MKIGCDCGEAISDSTDYLPYKAAFIGDADWDDLLDALEALVAAGAGNVHALMSRYAGRRAYQCQSCGRLYLDALNRKDLHAYVPAGPETSRAIFRSARGDAWPGPVIGHWRSADGKGTLFWGGGGAPSGHEEFADWEALLARYRALVAELSARGLLRSKLLRKDGVDWPD